MDRDTTIFYCFQILAMVNMDSITCLFILYRYDSTTGTFTVPSGGDGYYYFSTFLLVYSDEYAYFDIQINGEVLCTAVTDETDTGGGQSACGAAAYATEGL